MHAFKRTRPHRPRAPRAGIAAIPLSLATRPRLAGSTGLAALVALAGLATQVAPAAAGEPWPSKPIRIVVPFAPGGSTDPVARLVGQQLTEVFRQPVLVDNKPGGGTMIGTELVAKSPPDGYTLLLASTSHVVNPSLYPKVNYDPVKDFTAVSLAVSFPLILHVHPAVPAKSVAELIALAKANPGKLTYGSGGVGAANHLAGEVFKAMSGTDLLHVAFKGGGPALTAHLGGQVDAMFGSIQQSLPHVRSGKLRALAVSGASRSALAPELPTIAEAGVPGYDMTSWNGFLAPAGTPPEVVAQLNAEITRALRLPSTRETLAVAGAEAWPTTAAEAQEFIAREVARWRKLVAQAGIKGE